MTGHGTDMNGDNIAWTRTIGLLIDTTRPLRAAAEKRGWCLINLRYCNYQMPVGIHLDGLLTEILPSYLQPVQVRLEEQGCPIVRLGSWPHPEDCRIPAVLYDYNAAGRIAAHYLYEHGFQHVAYWGRNPPSNYEMMYEVFKAEAERFGMTCHLTRFSAGTETTIDAKNIRKQREFRKWIQSLPKPVGFFVAGDRLAAGYCPVIQAAGFEIPRDVAVLSLGNDVNVCECSVPSISSIDMDVDGRVEKALDLLADMMDGKPVSHDPVYIPPRGIVERQSTNVLATSDRLVAEALDYIWANLGRDFSVEGIAQQVGISSRQLERRFREAIGRTVNEEMRRKRLEESQRLLRETNLSITDVSPSVGFRSSTYFHRTFKAVFGISPRKYRLQQQGEMLKS